MIVKLHALAYGRVSFPHVHIFHCRACERKCCQSVEEPKGFISLN